ncbi:MAG: hypothetical protein GTO14_09550 [Anaerolineales bacterium]|nr:hypothetical protein [Anaerolineales bacterium]
MNVNKWAFGALLFFLFFAATACEESESPGPTSNPDVLPTASRQGGTTQRKHRYLGVDISVPEDGDYDRAFTMVYELGAREISLSVAWDDIESAPGVYDPDPNWLAIANIYYGAVEDVVISLMIGLIDTNINCVPSDLANKPFDDPEVIQRYQKLLDYVFDQIPDLELLSLSIGNEIDAYLGTDPELWRQYQAFYEAVSAYARAQRPGLLVGAKAQLDGLLGPPKSYLRSLNELSDVILVTYYPLGGDFAVKNPRVVWEDFQALVSAYEGRTIHMLEVGYPTSAALNSSESKQADFMREVFRTWDAYADQIHVVSFTWLTDVPQSSVEEMEAYYGFSAFNFAEFLRTLGLRTYEGSGEDKQAFGVLVEEAKAREW